MSAVRIEGDALHVGAMRITFHRTLRLPDDGRVHPLPPSLGPFPLFRVDDYAGRVPDAWRGHGGVFLPMWQREAMWLSFAPERPWEPQAVKVACGMVNAVSGAPWRQELDHGDAQDYLVCPPQPWIDGFKTADGQVRQFVAMPLGMGYTAEGQLTGEETVGGVQLVVVPPRAGRFRPPPPRVHAETARLASAKDGMPAPAPQAMAAGAPPGGMEMGLGAGGRMRQQLYPDPHGPETWDAARAARVFVHIANSQLFREITGLAPPETPVSAQTYAQHGLPWYDLYDEHLGDVGAAGPLAGLRSVKEMDAAHGFGPQQDVDPVEVPPGVVRRMPVRPPRDGVRDGDW